jgi:hypothetical protein
MMASGVRDSARAVRDAVRDFAALGADEIIFNPATDDISDVDRLADAVL